MDDDLYQIASMSQRIHLSRQTDALRAELDEIRNSELKKSNVADKIIFYEKAFNDLFPAKSLMHIHTLAWSRHFKQYNIKNNIWIDDYEYFDELIRDAGSSLELKRAVVNIKNNILRFNQNIPSDVLDAFWSTLLQVRKRLSLEGVNKKLIKQVLKNPDKYITNFSDVEVDSLVKLNIIPSDEWVNFINRSNKKFSDLGFDVQDLLDGVDLECHSVFTVVTFIYGFPIEYRLKENRFYIDYETIKKYNFDSSFIVSKNYDNRNLQQINFLFGSGCKAWELYKKDRRKYRQSVGIVKKTTKVISRLLLFIILPALCFFSYKFILSKINTKSVENDPLVESSNEKSSEPLVVNDTITDEEFHAIEIEKTNLIETRNWEDIKGKKMTAALADAVKREDGSYVCKFVRPDGSEFELDVLDLIRSNRALIKRVLVDEGRINE